MLKQLIVFDIDDTLYDEIDYVKSGFQEVAHYLEKKYALSHAYNQLMQLFQESSQRVFNRLLEQHHIAYTKEDILYIVDLYHQHTPQIQLSDEVKNVLHQLKEKYSMAIVSDGNFEVQKKKCEALHLEDYFSKIILTDELGKEFWKPNPKSFEILSKEFHVAMEDIYYVGDNPEKDFYLSQYGMKTIRYYHPNAIYFNKEYREGIKENASIDHFSQLIDTIEHMNSKKNSETKRKVLYVATVDSHIKAFHLPYLKLLHDNRI